MKEPEQKGGIQMQETETVTREIAKENKDLLAAREIARKRELREDLAEYLKREGVSIDSKMDSLIVESLNQLSLIRLILHNDDLFSLEGYELSGVNGVINEVDKMLKAASDLYRMTH
jgi:hypothetical protein